MGNIWQALIPVGASIIGWGLAMVGQAIQAGRENTRGHYYKVLERTEDIFSRCLALSDSIYAFHKECLDRIRSGTMHESIIYDIITNFERQMASIYMSARIFYPGIKLDTGPITRSVDTLTTIVQELWELVENKASAMGDIGANQTKREKTLRDFSDELSLIMNILASSLNKKAKKLRIQAEPVTVDRTKLPSASNQDSHSI
jgi:hypothetical protein